MRLGVVMAGAGVYSAACVGVMQELSRREIEPYAVCGVLGGAWPAALYAAGWNVCTMEGAVNQAGHFGRRLLLPAPSVRRILTGRAVGITTGRRIDRLLEAQAGQRLLSLCPRPAAFLCRTARIGHRVIFSTRAFRQEDGTMLSMQATLSFAARAAMGLPPILPAMDWMGSTLLPETDLSFAVRQAKALGAQRVLVIVPKASPRTEMDALDLAALNCSAWQRDTSEEGSAVLRIQMPEGVHALDASKAPACMDAGRRAAEEELDRIFERMGMAFCRVLPFRTQLGAIRQP